MMGLSFKKNHRSRDKKHHSHGKKGTYFKKSGGEDSNLLALSGDRIAKCIARSGLCSRRDAEKKILLGQVCVNGHVLQTPAYCVQAHDRITVQGRALPPIPPIRLWMFFKPEGLVTTHQDPWGRPTVFDHLSKRLPRVISVGRLDLNSQGLLLLTNHGGLARFLEWPNSGIERCYHVRVRGRVNRDQLASLSQGLSIDGVKYGSIQASLERQNGANAWIRMGLEEGKNREIRRIMDHFGWPVNRLLRTSYGPFVLGDLKLGQVKEIPLSQIKEHFPDFFKGEK